MPTRALQLRQRKHHRRLRRQAVGRPGEAVPRPAFAALFRAHARRSRQQLAPAFLGCAGKYEYNSSEDVLAGHCFTDTSAQRVRANRALARGVLLFGCLL